MRHSFSEVLKSLTISQQSFETGFAFPDIIPSQTERAQYVLAHNRLNLAIPVISQKWMFGGVVTALRFFEQLAKHFTYTRILVLFETRTEFEPSHWSDWTIDDGSFSSKSILFLGDGSTSISVTERDFFVATAWMTAVYVKKVLEYQQQLFSYANHRFVYLIQDYEPGYYPFSVRYEYARSTYLDRKNTIAVFNTRVLADYFSDSGLTFLEQHAFDPVLNPQLRRRRAEIQPFTKQRLILVYARPLVPRNAFDLIVDSLKLWARDFSSAEDWSLVSAGDPHEDIVLAPRVVLRSRGKLSMDEYADHLAGCWIGLSFMFLAHPSYPPLEMAEFGAWVVTNKTEHKDISKLAPNIISVGEPTPEAVSKELVSCCEKYRAGRSGVVDKQVSVLRNEGEEFPFLTDIARSWQHDR